MYHFSIFDQFSKLICGFFHFLISIGTQSFLPVVKYQLFSPNENSQLSQSRRRLYMSSIVKLVIGSFWRQQEVNLIAILFMPFGLYLLCTCRTWANMALPEFFSLVAVSKVLSLTILLSSCSAIHYTSFLSRLFTASFHLIYHSVCPVSVSFSKPVFFIHVSHNIQQFLMLTKSVLNVPTFLDTNFLPSITKRIWRRQNCEMVETLWLCYSC